MTFDEWWVDQHGQNWRAIFTHSAKDAAEESWNAATKVEREACAKVCENTITDAILGGNKEYNTGREMGAIVCANKIRMRSNEHN